MTSCQLGFPSLFYFFVWTIVSEASVAYWVLFCKHPCVFSVSLLTPAEASVIPNFLKEEIVAHRLLHLEVLMTQKVKE